MTNVEGRVIRRKHGPAAARRGAGRPADAGPAGRRNSAGDSTSRTIRGSCSTSCGGPAPAASPTTPASPTSGSTRRRASSGPAPTIDHPGTPRMFSRALRHPGRPGAISSGAAQGAGRDAGRQVPLRADHRPADDASTRAAPRPGGSRRTMVPDPHVQIHPDLARRLGHRRQRPGRAPNPQGRSGFPCAAQRRDPARGAVRAVPLGRRVQRQLADRPRARPAVQDAGVQGLRRQPEPHRRARRRRAADRHARSSRPCSRSRTADSDRRAPRHDPPHFPIPPADRRRTPACTRRTASCKASTSSPEQASTSRRRWTPR